MKFSKLLAMGLLASMSFTTVVNAAEVKHERRERPRVNCEVKVVTCGAIRPTTTSGVIKPVTSTTVDNYDIVSATIVEVNGNQVVVTTNETDPTNPNYQTVINVTEDTNIAHYKNRRVYALEDLAPYQAVSIKTNGIMTSSIPAQTTAESILLLVDEVIVEEEEAPVVPVRPVRPVRPVAPTTTVDNYDIKSATIVEVNGNQIIATVQETDPTNPAYQIVINVTENTSIAHHQNRRAYTVEDLAQYQSISVKTNGMMTRSIPAQTTAESILVLS